MKSPNRLELGRLALGWDEGRTERLLARVKTRLDRRARIRRAVLTSAVVTSVVCGALIAFRVPPATRGLSEATTTAGASASVAGLIRLEEGSEIRVDRATSAVRVVEEHPSRVRVEALRGGAWYSVVPNPGRVFEVHAGTVTVSVVGTEFLVERRGEQTWVEVSRGKVQISWGDGGQHAFVAAGESGLFPRAPAASAAEDPTPSPAGEATAARIAPSSRAYRSRIGHRDYRAAFTMLARHPGLAGDTVEELLLAADVARLSEHSVEAVPYLQRILREHPGDERAHQAAFTLGRTLTRLGRTQEALAMFARVRRDWPGNPLAEDALVRQAQVASMLGDLAAARRLAEEYGRDYPRGHRSAEVHRYARLE